VRAPALSRVPVFDGRAAANGIGWIDPSRHLALVCGDFDVHVSITRAAVFRSITCLQ
jgi:hypothetical protein